MMVVGSRSVRSDILILDPSDPETAQSLSVAYDCTAPPGGGEEGDGDPTEEECWTEFWEIYIVWTDGTITLVWAGEVHICYAE